MLQQQPSYVVDPYLKELNAIVLERDGSDLVLDDTIFYPNGGGQPGDTGVVKTHKGVSLRITDTRRCRNTGRILHRVEDEKGLIVKGDTVSLHLDWERRYAHMRMHTCLHLLSAVIPESVTGGGLTDQKGRLDFCLKDGLPDKQQLSETLNALIQQKLPVVVEMLDESVLDERPELVRTMSVQPPRGVGMLRMIRIKETDFQPCGGTHVANTSEIGPVIVAKVENKGKQNKRVHIAFDVNEEGDSPC